MNLKLRGKMTLAANVIFPRNFRLILENFSKFSHEIVVYAIITIKHVLSDALTSAGLLGRFEARVSTPPRGQADDNE